MTVDEFRIATAEVFDVIVEPKDDRAYTIFAQSMDRSGYARGTIAPRPGMSAEVPALDPRQILTLSDIGMSHDVGNMAGMDHGAMNHGSGNDTGAMAGMDHSAMDHSKPDASTSASLRHSPQEFGPTVDSTPMQVSPRLDDPGPGLRNNGRRVLTYADLHTLGGPIDRREASREIELHLTGHMERFIWSFSGEKFSGVQPLRFNHGERLRIVLVNDSIMTHPSSLVQHGCFGSFNTIASNSPPRLRGALSSA